MRRLKDITFLLDNIEYEIHCGRHSGFSECCIKFFVTKWTWYSQRTCRRYWKKLNALGAKFPGYIPCPTCLKNKTFVKVKRCPKNCRMKIRIGGKYWYKKKEFQ